MNGPKATKREPHKPASKPGCFEQVEQTLDDALADSFPASDPVSIVTSQREEAWEEEPEKPASGAADPEAASHDRGGDS